ncbi:ABC transporter ATP-binding protein [bacterium]|nr:ABC transporter ATP-binding protein [bacterium]
MTAYSQETAVRTKQLTKRFGSFTAVSELSISVKKGEIYGFLGPNGSGKSTTIRMLCGLLLPTSGEAEIVGCNVWTQSEQIKGSIGYMSQAFSLYRDLSVRENIDFFGGVYGLKGKKLAERRDFVISVTNLERFLDRESGKLSGGWKQRLALACALIHDPQIIFLDEPTAGIDPVARRELWDLLFELSAAGKTLFVTTHYMDEAERCSSIAYIYNSKLMVQGTPQELKSLPEVCPPDTRRISIEVLEPSVSLKILKNAEGIIDATLVEGQLHVFMPRSLSSEAVAKKLIDSGVHITGEIKEINPSLEDVFVALTRSRKAK